MVDTDGPQLSQSSVCRLGLRRVLVHVLQVCSKGVPSGSGGETAGGKKLSGASGLRAFGHREFPDAIVGLLRDLQI